MNLKKALFAIRSIGLGPSVRTTRYTLLRDRWNRKYPLTWEPPEAIPPGKRIGLEPLAHGAALRFENARLEVIFLADDLVRLSWEPGRPPLPYALARLDWPGAAPQVTETAAESVFTTPALQVAVGIDGGVRFSDASGRLLRQELPPAHQTAVFDPAVEPAPQVRWTHTARLADEERIYGLGERAAPLNRRGRSYQMWNSDPGGSYGPGADPLYIGIPVFMGMHRQGSYLLFYDNSFPASLHFDPPQRKADGESTAQACFEGGMLRSYFIPGPPERCMSRYSELTGRAPLPPRWALGYHQCRWGYRTEQDVREVVAGFKEHDLPLSAIHLDIDYMDGYRVFTVSEERFPNLKQLAGDLEQDGVRLVTIIDPGIKVDKDYSVYKEGLAKDSFIKLPNGKLLAGLVWPGWAAFPDFTDPQVRAWWGEQYDSLLNQGVDGIWHDMNEPSSFTAWGDMTLPLAARHNLEGRQGTHREAHNLYGLLMNRAGYEGLRRLRPDRRPWIITRAAWAGYQRYAWNWTGDTETSWAILAQTIPTVIGLGLSGQPFSGPDIGGFSGSPSSELYLRWFQLSACLPYFRTHSAVGTARREPWVYGEETTAAVRQALNLRYRLMPYFYTQAWQAGQAGAPMVRPLWWADPQDEALWDVDDAFLLGPDLLAAPILQEGGRARSLRLPAGQWYLFDEQAPKDAAPFEGGQEIHLEGPLNRLPILARAGSVIPTEVDGKLVVHAYAGTGASLLYSDAGDGYGPWRLDRFELTEDGPGLRLTRTSQGEYPFSYKEFELIPHGFSGRPLVVDGNLQLPGESAT